MTKSRCKTNKKKESEREYPSELWLNILYLLDFRDLCKSEGLSKNFEIMARDDRLWKELCQRSFILTYDPKEYGLANWKELYKYELGNCFYHSTNASL
jgi:hypothetical protein